jgi:RNA polymerase sigma-70 factor (ECF subfamily)
MLDSNFSISLLGTSYIPDVRKSPQALTGCSEAEVVSEAKAGNHEAFAELYSRHKKRVFSICMRMVRDFSLAEDLAQETFLQVHRKLALFRGESSFTTWLHRTAVNTALMHLRKQGLNVISLDYLAEEVPEVRAGRVFGSVDLRQTGAVDRLAIERAVADLAPGYRTIFELHDVLGFDHGEIAFMLKCSRGNTKSQLHQARRMLRRALKPCWQGKSPVKSRNDMDLLPMSA